MFNFNLNLVLQVLISASIISANSFVLAGQYDNQVLDEVSAQEFIMILDQPVPKLFRRTQLPNAQNNLCTVNNGQASSVAIASKLRVVGSSGAVTTLQAATGSNSTGNTTANTTAQNNTTAQANNNKPNANTSTSTSTNNRANSGEVVNTQNSRNQTGSANNSTYVPSLPTPRTNSGSANGTTTTTTATPTPNNSSTGATNNTGSNSANTSAVRTNNHTTANNNANATASTERVNNQANTVQNTQARPTAAPTTNQNKPNADVPYVGNAIATVNLAVNFGNDSDKLSVKDKTLLKELAQALNSTELRQAEFAIVGHTNSTGPYLRNLELSCARAIAVRNHLVNLGVKGKRLTPYGYGPDKPLANMPAQEVGNRRVEISRAK